VSPFFKASLLLSLSALITSCGPLSDISSSSSGRDALGHRPGPRGFRTVIIDAGHGGKDSGAVSPHTGQKEKDLALDTAKRIANALRSDFKVILMRSDDTFIDLDERVARANRNGSAILISMHYNSGPSFIRGPETYYWRVDSHGLATRLQQALAQTSPVEISNRGLVRRRIRLTRNPEIPCILLEGGYLSHSRESRQISDASYRQKLANAIATAIRAQAALGDSGTGPLPRPLNSPLSRPSDARE
jgi:N-acetylmuramoyl-L-alanine amidase